MPTISYGSETLCVSMMPEGIGKTLFSATYIFMKHIYIYVYAHTGCPKKRYFNSLMIIELISLSMFCVLLFFLYFVFYIFLRVFCFILFLYLILYTFFSCFVFYDFFIVFILIVFVFHNFS